MVRSWCSLYPFTRTHLGLGVRVLAVPHLQRLRLGTFGTEETGFTRNNLPVMSATISTALHLRGLRGLRGLASVHVCLKTRLACLA